jgi:ATP-binding cassette subfamily F protein 3
MLRIDNISYAIAGNPLLEEASATIPAGHKVGIVGRNGAGKTTLFRLIRGELTLDGGAISLPQRARIGGVAQEVPGTEVSLLDTVLAADEERAALLASDRRRPRPHRRDPDAACRYRRLVGRGAGLRDPQGPRLHDEEQRMPCSAFSGGWRMRVALAGVLFAQPDLLLLDEPTNYLDLEGALWLESYLARYPHTVLIISHDRGLLNRAVGTSCISRTAS